MADSYTNPPAGAGDKSGSSIANAMDTANTYTWLRSVALNPGDRLIGHGTLPLPSAETNIVLGSSGNTNSKIEVIGTDAGWNLRAGRLIIEGAAGDLPIQIIQASTRDAWRFDHVHFKDATVDIIDTSNGAYDIDLFDCIVEGCTGGPGINGNVNDLQSWNILRTIIRNNSSHGIKDFHSSCILDSSFIYGNGGDGVFCSTTCSGHIIVNCIIAANTGDNISINSTNARIFILNNTLYGSSGGSGIKILDNVLDVKMLRNRITTNNQYAIEVVNAADTGYLADYNYTHGNVTGRYLNQAAGVHDVAMAGHGMVDPGAAPATHDYSLIAAAEGRRVSVEMDDFSPVLNNSYITIGAVIPTDAGGDGGGSKSRFDGILGIKKGIS